MRREQVACPDEPDELEQALEDITEMEKDQQEQLSIGESKKRLFLEKEKETAETMRKRAMERMGETRARENIERGKKEKVWGGNCRVFEGEKGARKDYERRGV